MHINVWLRSRGLVKKRSQTLLSGTCWKDNRQWTQIETQEQFVCKLFMFLFKHKKKHFHSEDDQALEHCDWRSFGVPILGRIQSPTGHNLEQSAVTDPPLSRSWARWSPEVPSDLSNCVVRKWQRLQQLLSSRVSFISQKDCPGGGSLATLENILKIYILCI